jgi:hypothetical protein
MVSALWLFRSLKAQIENALIGVEHAYLGMSGYVAQ